MLEPRYVDTREAPERLQPLERAGFRLRALATGDVQFPEAGGGLVLIENKKVEQLLADMTTGQLVRQCRRLVDEADYPWLLIEGPWRVHDGLLAGSRFGWHAVWNELATLQDMGVRMRLASNAVHTVESIFELAEYYAKGLHVSALRKNAGDPGLATLALIPGVGAKTAADLLGAFGSLASIAAAPVERLVEVPGIGEKTAARIRAFWTRPVAVVTPIRRRDGAEEAS